MSRDDRRNLAARWAALAFCAVVWLSLFVIALDTWPA